MTELTEAEVDALCAATGYLRTDARRMERVTKAVARIIDARLAPIRALAERWVEVFDEPASSLAWGLIGTLDGPQDLRAVLDAASAPVSAQQDHDGTEGQGEGEKALCGVPFGDGWTCELPKGHDEPDTHAYWPRWNVKAQ